jgi:hypothetical protein
MSSEREESLKGGKTDFFELGTESGAGGREPLASSRIGRSFLIRFSIDLLLDGFPLTRT